MSNGVSRGSAAALAAPPVSPAHAGRVLSRDDVDGVLSESFYARAPARATLAAPVGRAAKPAHYKVICISLYTEDLERLDAMVDQLKARGLTKASRSALIRHALDHVDLDDVPRGM